MSADRPPPLRTASTAAPSASSATVTTSRAPSAARLPHRNVAAPSVSLSPLTTRSSSTTRLHQLNSPANESHQSAYRAWRRDSQDRVRAQQQQQQQQYATSRPLRDNEATVRPSRKKKANGAKSKAVAFVVGAPSSGSGEEGDEEQEEDDGEEEDRQRQNSASKISKDYAADLEERRMLMLSALTWSPSTTEDVIQSQIRQPIYTLNPVNLDPLLQLGIGDYTYSLSQPTKSLSAEGSPTSEAKAATDPPPPHPHRVSLGKGKFSEVLLASKAGTEYAVKHTPLHPHHPLIATRLLREPTILAQLLPHPNLVKVYETIRTPGHFYLVEENLQSSITLEELVVSSPGGVLPLRSCWDILEQLASVVRSLHEPLRVCHRDIKPENILVKVTPAIDPTQPPTLLVKLLDFGLATHFSASEAKLTTCCGSPAYHSPELWRGLREPSGTVRYWGPDVDIWCLGLTILRCLTTHKYPLGISHTSLHALSDKVVDALLAVEDESMRRTLAGLLHMDGSERMSAFTSLCERPEVRARAFAEDHDNGTDSVPPTPGIGPMRKDFKSTTFLPTTPQYSLDLPLLSSSDLPEGPKPLEARADVSDESVMVIRSRSPSRSRPRQHSRAPSTPGPLSEPDLTPDLSSPQPLEASLPSTPVTPIYGAFNRLHYHAHESLPPPIQLILLNTMNEPIRRAASYIKYALRCAGILYHVQSDATASQYVRGEHEDDEASFVVFLQCVLVLPSTVESNASVALRAALRPPMIRAHTVGNPTRSSSTPPIGCRTGGKKRKEEDVKATTFFLSIRSAVSSRGMNSGTVTPNGTRSDSHTRRRRSRSRRDSRSNRIVISLSDERALKIVRDALRIDSTAATAAPATPSVEHPPRGRLERGASSFAPTKTKSPNQSKSRDARLRRAATSLDLSSPPTDPPSQQRGEREQSLQGLAMSLGPLRAAALAGDDPHQQPKSGFFDFVRGLMPNSRGGTPAAVDER